MARIRSIKPEFQQSESMGNVSRNARLTFILLWPQADDEGRLRGVSRALASLLYPYDDDAVNSIDAWLAELERERCITRYVVGGKSYIQICNWLSHQKIDHPSKSKLPPPPEASENPREDSRDVVVGSRIKDQGKDQGSGDAKHIPPEPPTGQVGADSGASEVAIQREYPKFAGRQNWITALKLAASLVESGAVTWDQLIAACKRYCAYCTAPGMEWYGAMNPVVFFSAVDKPWSQEWEIKVPAASATDNRLARAREELRRLADRRAELGIADFRAPTPIDTPETYETAMRLAVREAKDRKAGTRPTPASVAAITSRLTNDKTVKQ